MATGVAGLDAVLGGGLLAGGLHIVQGAPGTGKTILANQICFHRAGLGQRVVYLTLLGEPHDRMLQHLACFAFTDLSRLPDPLSYVSAYGALADEGLAGLLVLIRDTMRERGPSLLVLDGLYVAQELSGSDPEFRRFVHALQGEAGLHGCTMLFLTNDHDRAFSPERTMVDGLIELRDDLFEARAVRSLLVRKLRGGAIVRGHHMFRIREDEGVVVFPRLEALVGRSPEGASAQQDRVSTGVDDLDRMLMGGLPPCSTTLVAGPSGSGKTTIGLLFLGRSTPAAPGLLFGCNESPDELRRKAASVGIDFDGLVGGGALRVAWQAPYESLVDEMAHRLLDEVRGTGARRVVIDGIDAFRHAMVFPGRLRPFFTALSRRLRAEGTTTLCTTETRGLLAPQELALDQISGVAENVLLLRFAEHRSRLLRTLSVVKVRRSGLDSAIVPFEIGDRGIAIRDAPADAEAIVSGAARTA
ncbi:MAG TPA: ATPase domain-containing protein [Geminicoccaceae bacterium]|nr:ATPase domain-containing protein [Geminicoccaceae bacterium]